MDDIRGTCWEQYAIMCANETVKSMGNLMQPRETVLEKIQTISYKTSDGIAWPENNLEEAEEYEKDLRMSEAVMAWWEKIAPIIHDVDMVEDVIQDSLDNLFLAMEARGLKVEISLI